MTTPTVVQSAQSTFLNASFASPVSVGNYIVASVGTGTTQPTVTDNLGNTYSLVAHDTDSGWGSGTWIFVAPVTTGGTITSVGTGSNVALIVAEITGTTGVESTTATTTAFQSVSTSASATLTASSANGSLIISTGTETYANLTTSNGTTLQSAGATKMSSMSVTAGTITSTWNVSASDNVFVTAVSFAGVSSGPSGNSDGWPIGGNVAVGRLLAGGGGGPVSRTLTALAGTYSLTGGTAVLKVGRSITASAGTYSLTGGTATLKVGRSLTASAGTYSLTGGTAVLKVARQLTANAGTYSITGGSATLTKLTGGIAYSLTGLAGSYSLTGGSAALSVGRKITALAGSYSVTGGSANMVKVGITNYTLTANPGVYSITGGSAVLTWSGEASGAGRKKKYQVETEKGIIEVDSLEDAQFVIRQAKQKKKESPVSVSLNGVKVKVPSRANIDYKAAEARLLAQIEAELDDEDILLLL